MAHHNTREEALTGTSENSSTVVGDNKHNSSDIKDPQRDPQHLEVIRTVSRVPGNPNYYEKDGLRTYGDDEDHDHEPPVR
jgi:hypothetical protein